MIAFKAAAQEYARRLLKKILLKTVAISAVKCYTLFTMQTEYIHYG